MSESVVTLSRFQADVSRSLARRGKRMLDMPDLAEQVAKLEPLEAYLIVKELGVEDAYPILKHATREQLQTLVDLDCWEGWSPDIEEINTWLAAFADEGPEALAKAFSNIDPELQVWLLNEVLTIYDAQDPDQIPEPKEGNSQVTTPDGYFVVESRLENSDLDPLVLIDAIYRHDVQLGFTSLYAAIWELPSTLEEMSLNFRQGRLESLGFPSRDEALRIFARPAATPSKVRFPPPQEPVSLPALYMAPFEKRSLLGDSLRLIVDNDELNRIEVDLRALINHTIVAWGKGPRDIRHIATVATYVQSTVSLGLEALLSPDAPLSLPPAQAAQESVSLLATWSIFEIFRHGHHVCQGLISAAEKLAKDPVIRKWLETSDIDESDYGEDRLDLEFVRALLRMPLQESGFDALRPTDARPFATKRQVEDAEERLRHLQRPS